MQRPVLVGSRFLLLWAACKFTYTQTISSTSVSVTYWIANKSCVIVKSTVGNVTTQLVSATINGAAVSP